MKIPIFLQRNQNHHIIDKVLKQSHTTNNLPHTKSPTTIYGISWKGGVYMNLKTLATPTKPCNTALYGSIRKQLITERGLVEMISLDILRHLLIINFLHFGLIPQHSQNSPNTLKIPPTLLDRKGLTLSEIS